jgi:hypothetical protein
MPFASFTHLIPVQLLLGVQGLDIRHGHMRPREEVGWLRSNRPQSNPNVRPHLCSIARLGFAWE